ncbi:hypothetical protein D3C72_1794250 [compost metagenome]
MDFAEKPEIFAALSITPPGSASEAPATACASPEACSTTARAFSSEAELAKEISNLADMFSCSSWTTCTMRMIMAFSAGGATPHSLKAYGR